MPNTFGRKRIQTYTPACVCVDRNVNAIYIAWHDMNLKPHFIEFKFIDLRNTIQAINNVFAEWEKV